MGPFFTFHKYSYIWCQYQCVSVMWICNALCDLAPSHITNGADNFQPMFPFYSPWKHQKTFGFLLFSGGIKWEHWPSWERSLSYCITCSFLVKSTEATRLKHRTEINLWVWKISCDYFYQSLLQLHVMLNYFLINLTIYVVNLSILPIGWESSFSFTLWCT